MKSDNIDWYSTSLSEKSKTYISLIGWFNLVRNWEPQTSLLFVLFFLFVIITVLFGSKPFGVKRGFNANHLVEHFKKL